MLACFQITNPLPPPPPQFGSFDAVRRGCPGAGQLLGGERDGVPERWGAPRPPHGPHRPQTEPLQHPGPEDRHRVRFG